MPRSTRRSTRGQARPAARDSRRGARTRQAAPRAGSRINPDLAALTHPIGHFKPDPENARSHPERNLASIRFSLERFGQQKPVVALRDGTVIAGNGVLTAARDLGWTALAGVVLNTDSREEARAFALADNRTAELAEWDFEKVAAELKALHAATFPIDRLGWADFELAPLLNAAFAPAGQEEGHGGPEMGDPIRVTKEQREVFERACETLRVQEGDSEMSEGRCVELLAAEFMS